MYQFSFCEGVWASPFSKWHIRRLTGIGPKYGGGIDTPSLCGCVTPKVGGWDLECPVREEGLRRSHICKECAKVWRDQRG